MENEGVISGWGKAVLLFIIIFGKWKGRTYEWREESTDLTLIRTAGKANVERDSGERKSQKRKKRKKVR